MRKRRPQHASALAASRRSLAYGANPSHTFHLHNCQNSHILRRGGSPMSFLSVLGKIGKIGASIAPAAVTLINPAAGALTSLVVGAVIKAEEGGGSGPEKKQQVVQQLAPGRWAYGSDHRASLGLESHGRPRRRKQSDRPDGRRCRCTVECTAGACEHSCIRC